MGTSEDKLKELILSKYKSIREFTKEINMPYSTVDSIFKRGVRKSSVDNIIRICKYLGISTDALIEGNIIRDDAQPTTIAAHRDLDLDGLDESEVDEVARYIEFIKTKKQ